MANELAEYAERYPYCAICWSQRSLHIHHMVQGAGRSHDRVHLVRLCERCHRALHDGGSFVVTKGMVLTAKREQDPEHFDPAAMAAMRHRAALSYECEPYTPAIKRERRTPPTDYMVRSRDKGARGERDAAAAINSVVPHAMAYRAQQHSGTESSSDVICPGCPDLWVEVKRVEKLSITATMAKAADQCGRLTPVIAHRKNGTEWLITCRLTDIQTVARNILNEPVQQN